MPHLNLGSLGRRIRAARVARRLTLEDVVGHTEFTVSWLSKIENGLLAPSLEGLVRLAEALNCSVEGFIEGLATPPRFVVNRAGEGRLLPGRNGHTGLNTYPLAESWRGRSMQPELFEIPSSGRRRQAESHDGERFLFVLEGDVKLTYGDEVVSLSPGDSIYFDASIPHLVAAAGRSTAKVLSVSHDGSRIQAGNGTAKPRRKGAGAIAGARA